MPFYEEVVEVIRAAHGFGSGDDVAFETHLRNLVPALHELRASYRSGWGSVAVKYTRAVTEAYMLAYYPHYVSLTRRALDVLPTGALVDAPSMRVCAFASGPAPEPIALAQYLRGKRYGTQTLALALFDIVPDRWQWARSLSVERLLPPVWDGQIRVPETPVVDITSPGFTATVSAFVARADLVFFQNCLYEFPANQAHVQDNARELISTMKPGAVLLMADINNYPTGRACLDTFATVVGLDADVLHLPEELLTVAPAPHRPAVLDLHFFLDGEYPRSRQFEFRCLAARVTRGTS